jgi:hypothetical protein
MTEGALKPVYKNLAAVFLRRGSAIAIIEAAPRFGAICGTREPTAMERVAVAMPKVPVILHRAITVNIMKCVYLILARGLFDLP